MFAYNQTIQKKSGLSILFSSPSTQSVCWSAPTTPLTPFTVPLHLAMHYTKSFGRAVGWKDLERFSEEWYTKLVGQAGNSEGVSAIPTLLDAHTTSAEPTHEVKTPIGEATEGTGKRVSDLEEEIAWLRELEQQERVAPNGVKSRLDVPTKPLPPYQQFHPPKQETPQLNSILSYLTYLKSLISTYFAKPQPNIRVPRRTVHTPLQPLLCETGVFAGTHSSNDQYCKISCSQGACPKELCRCVEGVEKVVVEGVEHGLGGEVGKVEVDFTPRGSERVKRHYAAARKVLVEGGGRDGAGRRGHQVPKFPRGQNEPATMVQVNQPVGPCPSAKYAGHDPVYNERCRRWCGKKPCPASLCRCVEESEVGRQEDKKALSHGLQKEVEVDPKLHDLVWDLYVEEEGHWGGRECVGGTWVGVSPVYDERCRKGCGKGTKGGKCPKGLCLCSSDLRK